MKELNWYIERNKKLLQERIDTRNRTTDYEERKRLTNNIEKLNEFIKGLEIAKECIEYEVK